MFILFRHDYIWCSCFNLTVEDWVLKITWYVELVLLKNKRGNPGWLKASEKFSGINRNSIPFPS